MNFRGIFPHKAVLPAIVLAVATSTSAYAADDNLDAGIAFVIFVLLLAIIYELPAIIAFFRGHPNRWLILVLCTALAGTGIVWLGCLVWAFKAIHISDDPAGTNGGESGLNLLANDVQRIRVENPSALSQLAQTPAQDPVDKLERLKKLLDDGAIDRAQYQRLRDLIVGV
ncbi:superinfection immunity protein [Mesorhizobium abyssinicae]|uniref:Superinfection immunity protein n=1 Tax=Mesorhizobium abyssinicae TaxID=1209958 RepID=A0ABU5ASB9_9HYPH|nr:superinfection immunity protein [Mesorhizobium abyssinicae]MDX8540107.1 superinfection immunity protein [Mesorhizobium abyssinicae]